MPDWLLQVIGMAGGGIIAGAVAAGGMREQVKALHEKAAAAQSSATRAHTRIDDHINQHLRGN